jgi:glycosyltransferase involved in cell wall biosynthesis
LRVLILAMNDWGGLGNLLTKSLCSVGVDAKFYVSGKTIYKHPVISVSKVQARKFSQSCDIIQYMHSTKVPIGVNLSKKKFVVFHGGGKYRERYIEVCKQFNSMVECSLVQTYDLLGKGCKNEKWILPPMDTEQIKPVYKTEGKKIIVGHYPSSSKTKGSNNIQKIINNIRNKVPDFEYRYSDKKVPWNKQMKRMSGVDIYIERLSFYTQGKSDKSKWNKTGVWGMTALEAASLGKIVLTNFYGSDRYKEDYGECSLQIANSEDDMEKLLIKLLSIPKKDLLKLKRKTRKWAEDYHSFEVVGSRLKKIYEEIL